MAEAKELEDASVFTLHLLRLIRAHILPLPAGTGAPNWTGVSIALFFWRSALASRMHL